MKEFIIRKRGNYVQRTCRIEEDLLDKLEELSYENNQSVNSIINDCIRFALNNTKDWKKIKSIVLLLKYKR